MKSLKKYTWIVAALVVALTTTSCRENEYGTVDLSGYTPQPKVTTYTYEHPCAMYTKAEIQARKELLTSPSCPTVVTAAYQNLLNSTYVQSPYGETIHAHKQIVRGDPLNTEEGVQNFEDACKDAGAAYQFGLLWLLTGDTQYADKGIKILNTWATVNKEITSNDADYNLAAGFQGFTFALAAEELRNYDGWTKDQFSAVKTWLLNVFAATNKKFLDKHASVTCGAQHYWANWDLANITSYMQIGILCENDDMITFAKNYFLGSNSGAGQLSHLVLTSHTDPLSEETIAQCQESGRDQGHATLDISEVSQLCRVAYALYQNNTNDNDLNFYTANNNALLHVAEYVALTNLRDGTDNKNLNGNFVATSDMLQNTDIDPNGIWSTVGPWCSGPTTHAASHQHTVFSTDSRGKIRPGWESLYQYYKEQGITGTKYIKQFADKLRPECGAGESAARYGTDNAAFDQIGWGTLMTYTEDN